MRFLLTLAVLISLIAGCEKDKNGFNPNYQLVVQGQLSTKSVDSVDSVLNVVKNARTCTFLRDGRKVTTFLGANDNYLDYENQIRDFENRRFLYSGKYVIYTEGVLGMYIVGASDLIYESRLDSLGNTIDPRFDLDYHGAMTMDTIAYIPNKILKKAQDGIIAAFNAGDYETCYELFDNAFIFIPTTGEKYRKLKELGIE